jgi:hypothetical protein
MYLRSFLISLVFISGSDLEWLQKENPGLDPEEFIPDPQRYYPGLIIKDY